MSIQTQLSNGNWVDAGDRSDALIDQAASVKQRVNREWVQLGRDEIISRLASGRECRIVGTDWYDNIRDGEAHDRRISEINARRADVPMVKCSCGHTIPRDLVMSASLGTSCPDCYDRMS